MGDNAENWDEAASRARGPFRNSIHSVAYDTSQSCASKWLPRDDMAWWSDGSSNQIIYGEKYYAPHEQYEHVNDATWIIANHYYPNRIHGGIIRGFSNMGRWPLARSGVWENGTECHHAMNRFGSWHPGVCNFVLGDGSVRAVPHSTPSATILLRLAYVNDGATASLP